MSNYGNINYFMNNTVQRDMDNDLKYGKNSSNIYNYSNNRWDYKKEEDFERTTVELDPKKMENIYLLYF